MSVHYQDGRVSLHHGDCLDVLAELPDNSIDAVCTDPPYGLSNTDPAHVVEALTRWINGDRDYLPSGAGFMGKAWDAFVPPPAVWDDCFRVLKPGGHLLVFAGTRTVDLMGLSIRLAGFDVRDSIAWLYASGFPKSLDVSKAIDKQRHDLPDVRRVAFWLREQMEEARVKHTDVAAHFGVAESMVRHWIAKTGEKQTQCPKWDQWLTLKTLIGFGDDMDAEVWRLNGRKGKPGEAWHERPDADYAGGVGMAQSWTDGKGWNGKASKGGEGVTDAARQWQGWGTALKPAHEPIVVARKPLAGTVAANVLEHGTGALNIDGCRVASSEADKAAINAKHAGMDAATYQRRPGDSLNLSTNPMPLKPAEAHAAGRWPANVILDEDQATALDQQSGDSKSPPIGSTCAPKPHKSGSMGGGIKRNAEPMSNGFGDSGGASRFFFVAKADASERPRVNGVAHPTVKPLALMRQLVRLVTPPGGTVLEPFAGSGTTVEAALLEGVNCVAIEKGAEYLPLILARIHRQRNPVEAIKLAGEDLGLFDLDGLGA